MDWILNTHILLHIQNKYETLSLLDNSCVNQGGGGMFNSELP